MKVHIMVQDYPVIVPLYTKYKWQYLLEELWLSFVQANFRFCLPIVRILYASSAEETQIFFKPAKKISFKHDDQTVMS